MLSISVKAVIYNRACFNSIDIDYARQGRISVVSNSTMEPAGRLQGTLNTPAGYNITKVPTHTLKSLASRFSFKLFLYNAEINFHESTGRKNTMFL